MRCLIACRDQGVYLLQEFVVMPDHVRLLLTLGDAMMREKAMQLIKGGRVTQVRGHTMQIWQPAFHEWTHPRFPRLPRKVRAHSDESHPSALAGATGRLALWLGLRAVWTRCDAEMGWETAAGAKAPFEQQAWIVGAEAPTP